MFWWRNDEENHDFHVDGDNKDNCPDKDDNVAWECVQSLSCFTSICFNGNEYEIVQNIDYIEGGDLISSLLFFEENLSPALHPLKTLSNAKLTKEILRQYIFIPLKFLAEYTLSKTKFSMDNFTNLNIS